MYPSPSSRIKVGEVISSCVPAAAGGQPQEEVANKRSVVVKSSGRKDARDQLLQARTSYGLEHLDILEHTRTLRTLWSGLEGEALYSENSSL